MVGITCEKGKTVWAKKIRIMIAEEKFLESIPTFELPMKAEVLRRTSTTQRLLHHTLHVYTLMIFYVIGTFFFWNKVEDIAVDG